jgi:calcium-translocating P-type ATPase
MSSAAAPRLADDLGRVADYARAPEDVAAALGTDASVGLSEKEAVRRLERFGPNVRRERAGPGYASIAARQLRDPLVALLIAAAAVSAAIGETLEAGVVAAIVVLNGALGFLQEAGAERALLALTRASVATAEVVRGGRERTLPADELVPGDVVVVREGDRVAADARLVSAERLAVDESALTGESAPIEKGVAPVPPEAPLAERSPMVYAGTGITRGRGSAVVTATGESTELGTIARLAQTASPPPTPLQRRLAGLSRAMIALAAALVAVLTAGMLLRGESLHEAFLVAVSVAVAAVPEGLAATVTIALAQGAGAMAARGAIVRRLPAVETLGSADVIATDKTGTLTVNQLRVVETEPARGRSVADLLEAGALASSAELLYDDDQGLRVVGDAVDGALLLAAREALGGDVRDAERRHRLLELPFDPCRRRLTTVWEEAGRLRVTVKGAVEELLARSETEPGERARLEAVAEAWARRGLRVLAVAERGVDSLSSPDDVDARGLDVVGLVALQDPLRPAARNAVRAARAAGIDVAMLTGDHPLTAASIAAELGLPPTPPVTGADLNGASPADRTALAEASAVFARVTPADKLALVDGFQRRGRVVAVTGDGVNDTPALRQADVGVAMGRSGTEAAREAADIVLTDDDFATIVAAIEEGRRIRENVRKFVAFLLSANLGEIVLFAIAVLAGIGVPMTVVQVLTVNLVTDGLPAIALARDPASPGAMRRPPAPPGELFSRALAAALAMAGLAVGLAATAAYILGREVEPGAAQTMAFATVALAELALVFAIRAPDEAAWRAPHNVALWLGVASSAAVVVAAIYAPPLQAAFGTVTLGGLEAGAVLALAAAPALLVEAGKAAVRRRAAAPRAA